MGESSFEERRHLETQILEEVRSFLGERGYPDDSIVPEPTIRPSSEGRLFRPDLVIVDPDRNERIAIVEVKKGFSSRTRYNISDRLLAYREAIGEAATEAYLITGKEEGGLNFYRLTEGGELEQFSQSEFPRFNAARANRIASKKEEVEEDREKTTDNFKVLCWSIGAVGVIFFAGDFILGFWNIKFLTAQRLAVLGVSVAVFVVPFAAKFKALGIEWERYSEG